MGKRILGTSCHKCIVIFERGARCTSSTVVLLILEQDVRERAVEMHIRHGKPTVPDPPIIPQIKVDSKSESCCRASTLADSPITAPVLAMASAHRLQRAFVFALLLAYAAAGPGADPTGSLVSSGRPIMGLLMMWMACGSPVHLSESSNLPCANTARRSVAPGSNVV